MKDKNKNGSALKASAIGAGGGFVVGGVMGVVIAVITSSLSNGGVWFMALHVAFALMLMGAWTGPCFLSDDQESCDATGE